MRPGRRPGRAEFYVGLICLGVGNEALQIVGGKIIASDHEERLLTMSPTGVKSATEL